ncbi:Uncharacterised protein g9444 [Pycnogonum litorale]
MGSSESSHRVTVVNEGVPDVIKISNSVAKRLRGEEEKASKTDNNHPENVKAQQKTGVTNSSKVFKSQNASDIEKQLRSRISKLEQLNDQLYKSKISKFKTSLDNLEKEYINETCSPVCEEKQQNVLNCYRQNNKQSLNCSKEVHDFEQCVELIRQGALSKQR